MMEIENHLPSQGSLKPESVQESFKKKPFNRKRKGRHHQTHERDTYSSGPIPQENALFEEYYRVSSYLTSIVQVKYRSNQ